MNTHKKKNTPENKPFWNTKRFNRNTVHLLISYANTEILTNCSNVSLFKDNLKIDGTHFSGDDSTIRSGCPMIGGASDEIQFSGFKSGGKNGGICAVATIPDMRICRPSNSNPNPTPAQVGEFITKALDRCNNCKYSRTKGMLRSQ